jgi:hypothetical protein
MTLPVASLAGVQDYCHPSAGLRLTAMWCGRPGCSQAVGSAGPRGRNTPNDTPKTRETRHHTHNNTHRSRSQRSWLVGRFRAITGHLSASEEMPKLPVAPTKLVHGPSVRPPTASAGCSSADGEPRAEPPGAGSRRSSTWTFRRLYRAAFASARRASRSACAHLRFRELPFLLFTFSPTPQV